ncbi:hypothetical protein [Thermanaeromonas toyohensis]|uniref:hypothetical protein n=1 Tax=Thermanaeromonas toyohensis TaxID=161154 RepID=UPI003BF51818
MAKKYRLTGQVLNTSLGVVIEVEGSCAPILRAWPVLMTSAPFFSRASLIFS